MMITYAFMRSLSGHDAGLWGFTMRAVMYIIASQPTGLHSTVLPAPGRLGLSDRPVDI